MDEKAIKARFDALELIIEGQQKRIAALEEKGKETVEKTPKPKKNEPLKTPTQTFKVADKTYKFKLPTFRIQNGAKSEKHKSEDALKDKDLLAKLVENKMFGVIELVK